ncbi:type 4a pilus biogenesis protein PilO [Methylovorus menthalis]|uniref:type 4a pilus biogenesis protein PilO n=1 Tax=Methylovorus menthalis TaxID=1002227 RepID=UPI001E64E53D|nr:type 4a pilus biogenesis protein PilO [Methylovorus menthalis]MCB4809763.1 type 4a pilus biogenesis protein PilO [Methylovorus menthalis]
MNLQDFNQIDLKTAGNLPLPVKAVLLGVMLLLIVAAGYWFVWSPSLEELDQAKAKEGQLREVFVSKKRQAINLDAYKKQMVEIERTFGALLKQLPDKSQMDGLLTDINQVGLERGLEFELFKPGQEVIADFYAEMPISIKVIGNYHDLGLFAADVSRLSRIVTLNDIAISSANKDSKDSKLVMEAVAKTYRYLDANEVAAKKAAEKANKK